MHLIKTIKPHSYYLNVGFIHIHQLTMSLIQDEHKLFGQKEFLVMGSYAVKLQSTDDYKDCETRT